MKKQILKSTKVGSTDFNDLDFRSVCSVELWTTLSSDFSPVSVTLVEGLASCSTVVDTKVDGYFWDHKWKVQEDQKEQLSQGSQAIDSIVAFMIIGPQLCVWRTYIASNWLWNLCQSLLICLKDTRLTQKCNKTKQVLFFKSNNEFNQFEFKQ